MTSAARKTPAVQDPRPDLTAAYDFLLLLSGIYAEAALLQKNMRQKNFAWKAWADGALVDVDLFCNLWRAGRERGLQEEALKIEIPAMRTVLMTHNADWLKTQVRHLKRINTILKIWTPVTRWCRILQLCEKRWQMAIERLQGTSSHEDADTWQRFLAKSVERKAAVRELQGELASKQLGLSMSFMLPQRL